MALVTGGVIVWHNVLLRACLMRTWISLTWGDYFPVVLLGFDSYDVYLVVIVVGYCS